MIQVFSSPLEGKKKGKKEGKQKEKNQKSPQTPRKTEPNFRPSHPPLHCNPLTSLLWARGQRGVSSQNFRRPSKPGRQTSQIAPSVLYTPALRVYSRLRNRRGQLFSLFFSFFTFFFLFIFLSLSASPSLYGLSASSESYSRRSSSSMDDFSWASCMEFTPRNSRES